VLTRDLLIYVKPTERCNLQCMHCYNDIGDRNSVLDLEMLSNFLKKSGEKIGTDSFDYNIEIVIHGGEPTLVGASYLTKLVNLFKSNLAMTKLAFSMQTNLVDINQDMIKFIKEELNSYIGTSYSPGLRFCNGDKDKFSIWTNNIDRLISEGIRVYVVVNLSNSAINELQPEQLYELFTMHKIDGFHFEPITKNGSAILNWDNVQASSELYDDWKSRFANLFIRTRGYDRIKHSEIVRKAKSFIDGQFIGCSCRDCMLKTITINSDGTIGACPNDSKVNKLGDLSNTVDDLFNSESRLKLIAKERARRLECIDCEYMAVCNGGCMQLSECYEGKNFFKVLKQSITDDMDFCTRVNEYERTNIFN